MAQSDFLRPPKKARKKKKRESVLDEQGQRNGIRNELLQDPFEVLGPDLLMTILSYVDARSVALSLLVSRSWYAVASSDRLWSSKVSVFTPLIRLCYGACDYVRFSGIGFWYLIFCWLW